MLGYNEIRAKKYIELNGEPYEVLSSDILRKQQRKPVNQTKLKNIISGRVVEKSFHQSDTVEEAELKKRPLKYLYKKDDEVWFCDPNDPKDRLSVPYSKVEKELNFITENTTIDSIIYEDEIIGFKLPIKVTLKVTEAPPSIRGNTSGGGNKVVVVETGAKITTPLFIEEGDVIEINTGNSEYVGRA